MIKRILPKGLKNLIKKIPIRFTKNQQYDYYTKKIINQILTPNSNCIDVGCFEGEILDLFLMKSQGNHYAFEPIPEKFQRLEQKYKNRTNVHLFNVALSDEAGTSRFNYVISNPSYSGLKKRDYDNPNEQAQQITVTTQQMDKLIPQDEPINLIKIDVEGAEYLVLKGAATTIKKWKPIIIFEHGLGASDKYGFGANQLFELIESYGLNVSNLKSFIESKKPLSKNEFEQQYLNKINYYFIAHP